jgi:hypothetical protein
VIRGLGWKIEKIAHVGVETTSCGISVAVSTAESIPTAVLSEGGFVGCTASASSATTTTCGL